MTSFPQGMEGMDHREVDRPTESMGITETIIRCLTSTPKEREDGKSLAGTVDLESADCRMFADLATEGDSQDRDPQLRLLLPWVHRLHPGRQCLN